MQVNIFVNFLIFKIRKFYLQKIRRGAQFLKNFVKFIFAKNFKQNLGYTGLQSNAIILHLECEVCDNNVHVFSITFVPMASSSSIKMMAGDFSLANAKASWTILAPSPINI